MSFDKEYPMKKLILPALAVMMLAGCNEPEIDTTTEETMKSSIQEVRNSLDDADKPRFDKAIEVVALSNISIPELLQAKEKEDDQFIQNKFKETLNGKSGEEVIKLATEIENKKQAEQRVAAQSELKALEEKQAHRELATEKLRTFEFKSSRIEYGKEVNGDAPATLIITMINPEKTSISGVHYAIERYIDGKAYPETVKTFYYEFPEAIAAGQKGEVVLSLGNKSAWAKDEHMEPSSFFAWLFRADGVDKKPVYDVSSFNENDKARLMELKQQLAQ